jgi:OmpA-OmpF porin, OOP family
MASFKPFAVQSTLAHAVSCGIALALCSTAALSQTTAPALNPQADRITDKAIQADLKSYEAQQLRIKALNDSGKHPLSGYPLAKAQCWLDVSFHEYTRNDRSAFPQEALEQSWYITESLSGRPVAGKPDAIAQTLRVNNGELLRPDLWEAATKLKSHAGFSCVAQRVACAEVELAHAGNEFNQKQWRHAMPYVQLAEDALANAVRAADACVPVAVPAGLAPVVVPAVPVVAGQAISSFASTVLFNYDKREVAGVRAYTLAQLDSLMAQAKAAGVTLQSVQLTGHADITNSTGKPDYNNQLSKDRVMTVRDYLVSKGIASNLITTQHASDSKPVVMCEGKKFRSTVDRQECLLPNRRVDVVMQGASKR